MIDNLAFLPLSRLSMLMARRELSPLELVDHYLNRIESLNPALNAFLSVRADQARREAQLAEQAIIHHQTLMSLHGIPIAIKDNIDVAGEVTTAGSPTRRANRAAADADIVKRLRAAGAVIIGKTNLHEFAQGATTINPHFGATHNPWNPALSPGGSSGGSAAAVSAGLCAAAVGTDTGGSIRLPAALCNLTGVRPAGGTFSPAGIVPVSHTLDVVGPLTRTARDSWLLLNALGAAGSLASFRTGLRLAVPRDDYFWSRADAQIATLFDNALDELTTLGAQRVEITLPRVADASRAAGVISAVESAAYHRKLLETPELLGDDVRQILVRGRSHTAEEYEAAVQISVEWRAELLAIFEQADLIALPTSPVFAPTIDQPDPDIVKNLLRFTFPFSLGGLPSLSLPCGFNDAGQPVGMQFIAKSMETILGVAAAYQTATGWATRYPSV